MGAILASSLIVMPVNRRTENFIIIIDQDVTHESKEETTVTIKNSKSSSNV